jgi:hypothetical protein
MRKRQAVRYVLAAIFLGILPHAALAQSSFSVTPLKTISIGVTMPPNQSLNATDNPVSIPLAAGTDTTLFHAGNIVEIDNEYFAITAVAVSNLTAMRAQLGTVASTHAASSAILRVYQLDVMLASPNTSIGAYQMNVIYDSAKLSVTTVNVFPGTGALGTPVAVNANTPGAVILNSFNASAFFQGSATPVARIYFAGSAAGTANISVNLTNLADTTGNDLDAAPNGISTTLSASSLTVMAFNVGKKGRGQITSQ